MTATDDLNALDALDDHHHHHHPHGDVSSSCVLCLQFDLSSVRKIECASQLIQPTKGYNPVDQQRTYEIQATLQTHKLPRLPGNGILLYRYHGQPAMSCLVTSLSFILIALGAACSGHFLAEDYVKAPSFNNSLFIAGPGGRQQVLYEDAQSGAPLTVLLACTVVKRC